MAFDTLDELARKFEHVPAAWWIAGGWAIDTHVGAVTRDHDDIDLQCLDRDVAALGAAFPVAVAEVPGSGERIPWDRRSGLEAGRDALSMSLELTNRAWPIQILIAKSDGEHWVYHRGNGSIRLPLSEITMHTTAGVPYLTPRIVLLFKSRQQRPKDHADFRAVLPHLEHEDRRWLAERIHPWDQAHPWLVDL